MQSTIPIVPSTKMTPQEPKKAKKSIALSKWSHLEAIRVDWQREIDQSSIADLVEHELTQNRRAAVVNYPRTVQYKIIDSSWRVNKLAFHFLHVERPRPITNCARMHTEWKRYSWHEWCNGIWTGWNGNVTVFLTATVQWKQAAYTTIFDHIW